MIFSITDLTAIKVSLYNDEKRNFKYTWRRGYWPYNCNNLIRKRFSVNLYTQKDAQDSVSGVAAAIWFPYKAYPIEDVNKWSLQSYNKYIDLAKNAETGGHFIPFSIVEKEETTPFWLQALPDGLEITKTTASYNNIPSTTYTTLLPLVETPLFLKYLQKQFKDLGGKVIYKTITSIHDLNSDKTYINCLGLGAAKIFGDTQTYPIQGQIVKLEPSKNISGLSIEFPFDEFIDEHLYIIPRSDCIIVGGSSVDSTSDINNNQDRIDRILNRAYTIVPELKKLRILDAKVGLRPGRNQVKINKDDKLNVYHNYGHGGSGYTIAWGCASHVANLIASAQLH